VLDATIESIVDDRSLALQDSKRTRATTALGGDKIKNLKLGLEDHMALFGPSGGDDDWIFPLRAGLSLPVRHVPRVRDPT
jgi:hypothetical protein